MKRGIISLIVVLIVLGLSFQSLAQKKKDPVLLTVAGEKVTKSEFLTVYKKNNKEEVIDKKSLEEYLDLYINFKLKVHEAISLGMDTAQAFQTELAGYRKQLAQPYLNDEEFMKKLVKEAYDRSLYDIRASHILIRVAQNASPEDTLKAYKKIMEIRKRIVGGEDFGDVAYEVSEDESARGQEAQGNRPAIEGNKGDLGYFSSMDMVYPFENAAYNTPVGEVSKPIRTAYGYHILKVYNKKPAMGNVQVAHLHKRIPQNATAADSANVEKQINEIYDEIKGGLSFEDAVKTYSDDKGSSTKGGVLPWFGVNRMVPEFIDAIATLKEKGDISKPVLTMYGWHIIKLIDQKKPGSFEDEESSIKNKITRDSRAKKSKEYAVGKIKKEFGFKEYKKGLEKFYSVVDTTILVNEWKAEKAANLKGKMFKIGKTIYTQQDFANYIESHQGKTPGKEVKPVVELIYKTWVDQMCWEYKDSRLEEMYPDFRMLMNEYHDGILLFSLTDEKVWSKAMKDTVGLDAFYERNKDSFMWGERLHAILYTCPDEETAVKVMDLVKAGQNSSEIQNLINVDSMLIKVEIKKFSKGDNELIDAVPWTKGYIGKKALGNEFGVVQVIEKVGPEPKKLEEAKGLITAAYQDYLEKEWIKELKAKYPVEVNYDVFNTIK